MNAISISMLATVFWVQEDREIGTSPYQCFGGQPSGGLWNHLGGITKQVEAGRAPSVYLANAKHPLVRFNVVHAESTSS